MKKVFLVNEGSCVVFSLIFKLDVVDLLWLEGSSAPGYGLHTLLFIRSYWMHLRCSPSADQSAWLRGYIRKLAVCVHRVDTMSRLSVFLRVLKVFLLFLCFLPTLISFGLGSNSFASLSF